MKNLSIIPHPKKIDCLSDNTLKINKAIFSDNSDFEKYTQAFGEYYQKVFENKLSNSRGGIEVFKDSQMTSGKYVIDTKDGVKLIAGNGEGICCALSTLLQIIEEDEKDGTIAMPDVYIEDEPDKDYRGFMVDLGRCFHPFDTLLSYIDICFYYKIKYLHLHFMDNEIYTLPSDIFPNLSTPGKHYTKSQIALMNEYADKRGITIIPEFEIPGHARVLNSSYPEVFANDCSNELSPQMYTEGGVAITGKDVICAGSQETENAIKALISEIMDMFPQSPYIHIGGDEVNTKVWNSCPRCMEYMKNNSISNDKELYTDFVSRIARFVIDRGRTPIVWEGFSEKGISKIPKETIVIAWESHYLTVDKILENGFRVINCSWQPLYIVPSLTECWCAEDILNWNVYNWQHWWEKSKACLNPITVAPTEKVLGAQICAWEQSYEMEISKVVENLAALSERCWNVVRVADDSKIFTDIRIQKKRLGIIITR